MIKKALIIIPVFFALILGFWLYGVKEKANSHQPFDFAHDYGPSATSYQPTATSTPTLTPTPTQFIPRSVLLDVPFAPQAPFGDWKDPRQQDACEEASTLLAMKWVKGEMLTYQEALETILEMAKYQTDKYGESRDTSAKDTLNRLIKGYFNYQNAEVIENIDKEDILKELTAGRVVITPMNGQALNNPHFTAPGPERHMVVIIGFDADTDEFITNDIGIKEGKGYRYPASVFMNAIRDYETGYHIPIKEIKKVMIVVEKPS
jgi:hypothetical protein